MAENGFIAVRKKKKKYKSRVWPLKVIYNDGRGRKKRQQEVVSHYRPPSRPKPNTCLSSQRDMVESQAGGLNLSKTFIKTQTGAMSSPAQVPLGTAQETENKGKAGHSGFGSISPHSWLRGLGSRINKMYLEKNWKANNCLLQGWGPGRR